MRKDKRREKEIMRQEAIEAAIEILRIKHFDDIAPGHYQQGQRYGLEVGYRAGYAAAIAAERERCVAAIDAKAIRSALPDAYEEGFDDGIAKAIEIVKGGDEGR